MKERCMAMLGALALAGCSGGSGAPDGGHDAAADAALGAAGPCGSLADTVVLGLSDYATAGGLACANPVSGQIDKMIDAADPQVVVRVFGGKVYTLDQTHGVLRIYDPAQMWHSPREVSLQGQGLDAVNANPNDVYVDPAAGLAYVTLFGAFGTTQVDADHALGIVNLKQPAGVSSFVKLALHTGDTDKNPDASRIFSCGGQIYVVLQDLDRNNGYKPVGPGRLAQVTPGTLAVQYLNLLGQNPTAVSVAADCKTALLADSGDQIKNTLGSGGVEIVDLVGHTSKMVATDTALQGNVNGVAGASATMAYLDLLSKSGNTYNHNIYTVDLMSGALGAKLLGPMNSGAGIVVGLGKVMVLSAGTAGIGQIGTGLYIGSSDGSPIPAQPKDLGLPPISAALFQQ